AMDLGAGLALREAWRLRNGETEAWGEIRRRLREVLDLKIMLVERMIRLRSQPELFVKTFWSNFYRATLAHAARNAMMKLLIVALGCTLLLGKRAAAQTTLNLVIAVDLSRSVSVHAPGQASEFQKNLDGVTRILTQVPAGSRLTIIG